MDSDPQLLLRPLDGAVAIDLIPGTAATVYLASVPSKAGSLIGVPPCAVLIENNTSLTIIAYALNYGIVSAAGESLVRKRVFYNFGIQENGVEIPPGGRQLATPFATYRLEAPRENQATTFDTNPQTVRQWITDWPDHTVIVVSLDLVILHSGKILSRNQGGSLEALVGFQSAKTEAMSLARSALARNLPTEAIAQLLTQRVEEKRQKRSREAMAWASEFQAVARHARRSRDGLISELSRLEANHRQFTFAR